MDEKKDEKKSETKTDGKTETTTAKTEAPQKVMIVEVYDYTWTYIGLGFVAVLIALIYAAFVRLGKPSEPGTSPPSTPSGS